MDALVMLLMAMGALFMFLAALGILRMPDLYMRVSACTKAATFGVAGVLLGASVFFDSVGVTSRAVATVLFVLLTSPVAGHMIGRAAYLAGTPLWKNTMVDELEGRYDIQAETLKSDPPGPGS